MDFCNKLEWLVLEGLPSLVYFLWVRPGAYHSVKYQKGASLRQTPALLVTIDQAAKACQGQTLEFIKNTCKLQKWKVLLHWGLGGQFTKLLMHFLQSFLGRGCIYHQGHYKYIVICFNVNETADKKEKLLFLELNFYATYPRPVL